MLVVGGDTLAPGEVDVDALLRNNHIHSAAQAFVRSPLHVVKGDTKAVCVLQSEAATVSWTDEVCLGSQNATTCVIAIVMCQVGATVLHIDEVWPQSIRAVPTYRSAREPRDAGCWPLRKPWHPAIRPSDHW